MKYTGEIMGIVSRIDEKTPSFEPKKILVHYTSDSIGKTLSLGSEEDKIQISVPYEGIEKIIKKGEKR